MFQKEKHPFSAIASRKPTNKTSRSFLKVAFSLPNCASFKKSFFPRICSHLCRILVRVIRCFGDPDRMANRIVRSILIHTNGLAPRKFQRLDICKLSNSPPSKFSKTPVRQIANL